VGSAPPQGSQIPVAEPDGRFCLGGPSFRAICSLLQPLHSSPIKCAASSRSPPAGDVVESRKTSGEGLPGYRAGDWFVLNQGTYSACCWGNSRSGSCWWCIWGLTSRWICYIMPGLICCCPGGLGACPWVTQPAPWCWRCHRGRTAREGQNPERTPYDW